LTLPPTARAEKKNRERALHPARPVTKPVDPWIKAEKARHKTGGPITHPSLTSPHAPFPFPAPVSTLTRPPPRRLFRLPSPCVSSLRTRILPIGPGQLETAGQLSDGNCRCRSWSLPIVELADRAARWLPPPPVQKVVSLLLFSLCRTSRLSQKFSNLSPQSASGARSARTTRRRRRGGGHDEFLHSTYITYKFNFSTLVAVRVFWPEPVEPSILLLFTGVFI
jgi:hypothetical protein